jgi:hypothetical protein
MAAERVVYKLKTPIEINDTVISELAFRRPKAKDMRGFPADGFKLMDDVLTLIGRLSGKLPDVIDELSIEDLSEVSSLIETFTASSPVTGSAPSQ